MHGWFLCAIMSHSITPIISVRRGMPPEKMMISAYNTTIHGNDAQTMGLKFRSMFFCMRTSLPANFGLIWRIKHRQKVN